MGGPAGQLSPAAGTAAAQTSPAVAALVSGGFQIADQATTGRELFTPTGAGPARDAGIALGVHDSPVMSVLPPTASATTVPALNGLSDADARTALTAAGLTAAASPPTAPAQPPPGSSRPKAPPPASMPPRGPGQSGRADGQDGSGGPCHPVVPNLFGDDDATALQAIAAQGLTVGTGTTGSSCLVNKGDVYHQNPAASTPAQPGQAVNIVESSGLGAHS